MADDVAAHKKNLFAMVTNLQYSVTKYGKARTEKDSWLRMIHGQLSNIKRYCSWFKVGKLPNSIKLFRDFDGTDTELFELLGKTFEAITVAEQRGRLKLQRERENKLREALSLWVAGKAVNVNLDALPIALRVVDDRIETSHGAIVPLNAALGLYDAIQTGKELPDHIGPYGPISHDGVNLHIGCHQIPLAECERLHTNLRVARALDS